MSSKPTGYSFKRRENPPSKAEVEIRKITGSAEQRCIALGSRYSELTLADDQMAEVEDDLRKARMFEVQLTSETMKQAEMDELRRRMLERERSDDTKRQRTLVQQQLMKQKALSFLQKEAEAVKREEDSRLGDDRRVLLQKEKEKLIDRRRRFETDASDGSSFIDRSGGGDRSGAILVMNVALGNGKEDRVVVRRYDDPKKVAMLFAKKHHLPDNAVSSLTQQIRANLQVQQQKEAQQHQRQHQHEAATRNAGSEFDPYNPSGGALFPAGATPAGGGGGGFLDGMSPITPGGAGRTPGSARR